MYIDPKQLVVGKIREKYTKSILFLLLNNEKGELMSSGKCHWTYYDLETCSVLVMRPNLNGFSGHLSLDTSRP